MRKQFLSLLLVSLLLAGVIKIQEIKNDDAPLKINTPLLTMPVTVSDGGGRSVAGLKKENFLIFQAGEELKNQYLLGFYPQNSETGKSSAGIRIEVDRKNFRVRTKKSWNL